MRYHEVFEAAPRIPERYMIDPDTDLALNAPNQWSQSPYLGAVKSSKSNGYFAQIHIPQSVWVEMVQQNPHKWSGHAPDTFFNEVGNQRPPMRVAFADPRQAAWFAQEVLYGGDYPTKDIIEDYFDNLYLKQPGSGQLVAELKAKVPHFEGEALKSEDAGEYAANPEAFMQRREAAKKARTQAANADNYAPQMERKIKTALVNFYLQNSQLAKKRFGRKFTHRSQLEQAVDQLVGDKGIDFFLTAPGSVKMKDIASLKF